MGPSAIFPGQMGYPEHSSPLIYTMLGWAGGAASTVVGSWIASKIHVYHAHRDAHRDAINEKVLTPLSCCIEDDFAPLVGFMAPLVESVWTEVEFKEAARSTEDQLERAEVLTIANP
jgi:uncharacterized membrane protein YGL010W